MHLIIGEVDGYIAENNGNKYLIFASPNKKKEVFEKYIELWGGIKNLIECSSIEKKKKMVGRVNMKKISWKSNSIQIIIWL